MQVLNTKLSEHEVRTLCEGLNPLLLPALPMSDYRLLPGIACIYFAIESGEVKYIGQTNDLRMRWNYHVCRGLLLAADARVAWLEISRKLQAVHVVERAFITRHQPVFNINHVSPNRRVFHLSRERHSHAIRASGLTLAEY